MEKFWIDSYEQGVEYDIDVKQYTSLSDMINQACKKFSSKKVLTNFGTSLNYASFKEMIDNFSSYLRNELYLKKGSKIAIMMPNVLQYPIAIFGALQAGLAVVNVNPLYTPRELEHQLKDCEAETIVIIENFANNLELILDKTNIKNIIVSGIGDLLGTIKGPLINFVIKKIKKMAPHYSLPQIIKFKDVLSIGGRKEFKNVPLTLEDIAFLQYTGGTTGVAKGAILSHGNICANVLQATEWTKIRLNKGLEENVVVTPLPLYHIFSLTINLMLFIHVGAENVLITDPRDLSSFIKELKKHKVTVLTGVNTLFNALVNTKFAAEFKTVDFSTWKIVLGGGAAVIEAVANKWQDITKAPIFQAYGLTECSPGVSVDPMNATQYSNNIGLPISLTNIEIRDEKGNVLGVDEPGELFVKGPQVMQGYWKKPEETARVLNNGWLETGDIVSINEKGFLKIVDRKKEIIIVSGFNVYPSEIEDVVSRMPGILEVACVGVPSEKTGEALKLYVVKKDPKLTAEDIIKYCRKNLTGYKIPKIIEFRDELPKTNVGKILKRVLKEENN